MRRPGREFCNAYTAQAKPAAQNAAGIQGDFPYNPRKTQTMTTLISTRNFLKTTGLLFAGLLLARPRSENVAW